MIAIKAHFDGRVIVPDEPVDLPAGQALIVRVEEAPPALGAGAANALPPGVSGASLLRFAGAIAPEDLRLMKQAIRDCEQVDPDGW